MRQISIPLIQQEEVLGLFVDDEVLRGKKLLGIDVRSVVNIVRSFDALGTTPDCNRIHWPLGYIAVILNQFYLFEGTSKKSNRISFDKRMQRLLVLESAESAKLGKDYWELIIQFALIFRYIDACINGVATPFNIAPILSFPDLDVSDMPCDEIQTMGQAKQRIDDKAKEYSQPTILLSFMTTDRSFSIFDTLISYKGLDDKVVTIALQTKLGDDDTPMENCQTGSRMVYCYVDET